MFFRLDSRIERLLEKGADGTALEDLELCELITMPLCSRETCALTETADRMSRKAFAGKGERHMHIGVNVAPCRYNCAFCSFSAKAGIFKENEDFSLEQVLEWGREGERQGADAINLMAAGTMRLEQFLEVGRALKKEVRIPLVANFRDITHKEGEAIVEAGFSGFYHAVRAGEGKDTPFSVSNRLKTIQVIKDVGLLWMNCVEPVGPEHDPMDLARLMNLARKFEAVYSGVMRRVNFPGSPLTKYGMINEREMARLVAVSRLAMGYACRAHCTHEPHTASLAAGANLFFPEVGSSPRDLCGDTEKGRGKGVAACGRIFAEMGWNPKAPSNVFSGEPCGKDGKGAAPCPSELFE